MTPPTTDEYLDPRRFAVAVRRLADSLLPGADVSRLVGSGTDYAQSRPYQPGDPVRFIDWRVTARTGTPFVKEYEAARRLPCWVVVDATASMGIASTHRTKFRLATEAAGGLALACQALARPAGLAAAGGSHPAEPPTLSRAAVFAWLHRMRRVGPGGAGSVGRRADELAPRLAERSLVVVLSDFHDPDAVPALKRLAGRHDVAAVHLMDPAEAGLPGAGFLRAAEAETGRRFVTHGGRAWSDPEPVRQELRRAGVDHLLLDTGKPYAVALRRFFRDRGVLSRGVRG